MPRHFSPLPTQVKKSEARREERQEKRDEREDTLRSEQKARDRLTDELSDSCNDDSCAYDYDGEGSARGDWAVVAWEQVVIFVMASIAAARVKKCILHKIKWDGINPTLKKSVKCLGWGTVAEIGAFAAVLTGEIVQSAMVNRAVKAEMDEVKGEENEDTRKALRKALG